MDSSPRGARVHSILTPEESLAGAQTKGGDAESERDSFFTNGHKVSTEPESSSRPPAADTGPSHAPSAARTPRLALQPVALSSFSGARGKGTLVWSPDAQTRLEPRRTGLWCDPRIQGACRGWLITRMRTLIESDSVRHSHKNDTHGVQK